MNVYDAHASLAAIDSNIGLTMFYESVVTVFAFVYFVIAFVMARKQKVYVVPFIGAALFLWHDFTFVLLHDLWFNVFNHWWLKMWWYALVGTVAFELVMLYQVYQYGHKELWPNVSKAVFGWLIVLGTLGVGAMWWLIKVSMGDELFFITFVITAVFSVPFHTALMSRRQTQAGQSVAMQLSTIVMLWGHTLALANLDPFFKSMPYMAFVIAFTIWPLANIAIQLRLPKYRPVGG
jgi:hypothetical protein